MRRRGLTLIELLVGVLVASITLAGFAAGMLNLWRMQAMSVGMPTVENDARAMALNLGDAIRSATLCTAPDTGCTVDAAAEGASATGITLYRRNDDGTLTKRTYQVANGVFQQKVGSAATQNISSGATLALVYYAATSYYSNDLTPYMPTDATLKNLAAVGIQATSQTDGLTQTQTTVVRLRNSPRPK